MAALLGVLTLTGHVSAWVLLGITFLMGLGAAFDAPAWQSIVAELVPREELPAAVSLNATGFNLARALGPALGGMIVALAGPAAVFLLNSVSFICVLAAVYFWKREKVQRSSPPEDVLGATAAGLRYTRHSAPMQAVLVRIAAFSIGASGLWALLPIVARRDLALDAGWYGVVLGSLGFGAVISALFMPRVRAILPVDRLAAISTLLFAGATLALAYVRSVPLLVLCMMVGGMGWLTTMSSMTTAATTAAPAWVRARTLGMYLLVFQGSMAASSFAWGSLAERFGNVTALTCAAGVLALGLLTFRRWPLHPIQHLDLNPSGHWSDPNILLTPAPDDGPVLVTVEYHVAAEQMAEFLEAMQDMRIFRRREGALRWDLFRDLAEPERFVESFVSTTLAEHMRTHERVTVEDQAIEARAFSFLKPGFTQFATHFIAARAADRQPAAEPPYTEVT